MKSILLFILTLYLPLIFSRYNQTDIEECLLQNRGYPSCEDGVVKDKYLISYIQCLIDRSCPNPNCNQQKAGDCSFEFYKCSVDESNHVKCVCLKKYAQCLRDCNCFCDSMIPAFEKRCQELACQNCTFAIEYY